MQATPTACPAPPALTLALGARASVLNGELRLRCFVVVQVEELVGLTSVLLISTPATAACPRCLVAHHGLRLFPLPCSPNDSYAWIPGSSGCLRCIQGVPTCVAGDIDGFACAASGSAGSPGGLPCPAVSLLCVHPPACKVQGLPATTFKPSTHFSVDFCPHAGSHILSLGASGTTCAVDSYLDAAGGVPIWRSCSWKSGSPTTQLALLINGDCSISIKPITDETCADPGAVAGQKVVGVKPDVTYGYTYNDLIVRAYYQTPSTIRSLMPAGVSTCVHSYWPGWPGRRFGGLQHMQEQVVCTYLQ